VEAKLSIRRDSPKDIKIRGLFILVDGREVANLTYGQSFEMVISPGEHTLKATNNLYSRSTTFIAEPDRTYAFRGANVMSKVWMVLIGWSGIAPYKVELERTDADGQL
jgi:hypothetical protein